MYKWTLTALLLRGVVALTRIMRKSIYTYGGYSYYSSSH
jgi:hypothetical protein